VKSRGFTLLEMMIAMAILSGALTWLVVGMSRNITAENHAKLMTTATFLAREKMVDFEDELYLKGFSEFAENPPCEIDPKAFPRFTCKIIVDKVELPSAEQIQTVLTKAQEATTTTNGDDKKPPANDPASRLSGANGASPLTAGAGALASQFGIIKDVLEQGIRRITVKVVWNEGRTPRDLSIVAYYTDVRKVDQAIQIAAQPPGGATTGGGGGGTTGGGGGTTGGGIK
jgi:prepilin-type N-terminal cleavage/methylation domain-containing protein